MENTEKFRMRKYSKQTATNIYAAHRRGVNKPQQKHRLEKVSNKLLGLKQKERKKSFVL